MSDKATRAVDLGVPADAWRKVSPLSPLLNTWSVLAVLFSILIINNIENLASVPWVGLIGLHGVLFVLAIAVGALVILVAIVALYSWISWRKTSYAVTDQAVWYRTGIIFRNQRHTRLERIQAVDIVHPLLPRLLRLGKISIEVAGASGSSLSFGYLKNAQLEDLRADILARAAGIKAGGRPEAAPATEGAPPVSVAAEVAPERELYRVPSGRLIASVALNLGTIVSLILAVAMAIGIGSAFMYGAESLWGLLATIPAVFGFVAVLWGRFSGEFNFRAAVSPDGIRVRRGLLETRAQTIPPRRVHAVQISQPFLWRKLGWYRVTIDQAGYGGEAQDSSSGDVLLPVGNRSQALLALWLVLPDLGVDDPEGFVEAALAGRGAAQGFTENPPQSKLFDPLVYRRRGLSATRNALVIRDGRISWSTVFVPYERIQSLGINQGPWDRRRDLATLSAHTVPGPVTAKLPHIESRQADELLAHIAHQAGLQRQAEPPERWMSRVQEAGDGAVRDE